MDYNIISSFQDQQREVPKSLEGRLRKVQGALDSALKWIDQSSQPSGHCIDCDFCKIKLGRRMRESEADFKELYEGLQSEYLMACIGPQLLRYGLPKTHLFYQKEPEAGLQGSEVNSLKNKLITWLTEMPHVSVIGVCRMGGIGKTALLKTVYNHCLRCKEFENAIWVPVAKYPGLAKLQDFIAEAISLNISFNSDVHMRKIMLSEFLKQKIFLLVLDDIRDLLDLSELGVAFGNGKASKVVFSTRKRDLIPQMNGNDRFSSRV